MSGFIELINMLIEHNDAVSMHLNMQLQLHSKSTKFQTLDEYCSKKEEAHEKCICQMHPETRIKLFGKNHWTVHHLACKSDMVGFDMNL